ncbi:dipicolinic acid synthetase subunit A [Bacillus massiliglaciei]|uniref:dipicolinic acid synthetase subunit A n=1 Tax=Bacillus massiliglaciei TaxID=1816693 RepID=UPI000A5FEB41|nr:dipicolinic acid synthetase subunit A [Bacillus massiliglaciei]
MLNGMQIAVIGGDARQLEVVRTLTELDAKLILVGFEQLDHAFAGTIKENVQDVPFSQVDAIILPVRGTDQDGKVETIFSSEEVILTKEMITATPEHCVFYSGISNHYLDALFKEANRKLVLLFERDDVAIYNSIPTVEGAIMMAIQHTDFTIHGSNIVVLGLGRVGMSVARSFQALGGKVKVGARKSEDLARITEMAAEPFRLKDLKPAVNNADIVINTIPYPVISAEVIAQMPVHTLIIDLASKPGGTDFDFAEKRGIKALLAPSLPGIVAPKTAGKILANALGDLLQGEAKKKRGNPS